MLMTPNAHVVPAPSSNRATTSPTVICSDTMTLPSGDLEHRAGGIRAGRRSEKRDRARNVFGRSRTPERDVAAGDEVRHVLLARNDAAARAFGFPAALPLRRI